MAEEGVLPSDYYNLITKFEGFYRIRLKKITPENKELFIDVNQKKNLPRFLDLSNPENLKNLTIDDLRRIKQMREEQEGKTEEAEQEVPEEKEDNSKKKGFLSWFKRGRKEDKNKENFEEEVEESGEEKKD